MREVLVFYATSEGQTRRIAGRIAATLIEAGCQSRAIEISPHMPSLRWEEVSGVVIGASLHIGRHQDGAAAFARTHRDALNNRPSAFFSVSLSAASRSPAEVQEAQKLADAFPAAIDWHPSRIVCFAGRLAYTKYGFLVRWMMKRIARKEGGPTDTQHDHELTDWEAVRRFALDVAADIRQAESTAPTGAAVTGQSGRSSYSDGTRSR